MDVSDFVKQMRTVLDDDDDKSQVELARRLGIPASRVNEMLKGKRRVAFREFPVIAHYLGLKTPEVLEKVPVVGKVEAGARVPLVDAYAKGDGLYHVISPFELRGATDVVAVEVEGTSMQPIYQEGDVLFYRRDTVGVPTEALGNICVCEDNEGFGWVKQIRQGTEPGLYHLISLNQFSDDASDGNRFNVPLGWASPVKLHWPKALVTRV